MAHKCNTNETPTIIQFNNVKDAVISVGISSNGRIIDGSNPHIIHSRQQDQASNNHIIIARTDGPQREAELSHNQINDRRNAGSKPSDTHGAAPFVVEAETANAGQKWTFSAFGNNEPAALKQAELRSRTQANNQQHSVCDAFLRDGYAPGQPRAYDASVYGDGSRRQPLDQRRQHDSQRPSNDSSYRQGEGAQAAKNLAESYGAKLPLKIQLKP